VLGVVIRAVFAALLKRGCERHCDGLALRPCVEALAQSVAPQLTLRVLISHPFSLVTMHQWVESPVGSLVLTRTDLLCAENVTHAAFLVDLSVAE
jgi:hypothetical protein